MFLSVNPIYYVCFTTATIIASAIMFQGWHTSSVTNTVSLICGFLIIFSGVYLLDMVAPLTNVTSSSLLEMPFSSSSCRVSTTSEKNGARCFEMSTCSSSIYIIDHGQSSSGQHPNSMRTVRRTKRALSV
jgi:hypothetical protein